MSQLYLLHSASGRTVRLGSEPVRAGSEDVCELRLASATAPARVASLRPLDKGWFLRDESGGVSIPRVNGAAALQVMLQVGDRIEMAGEEWVLKKGEPAGAEAKTAPRRGKAASASSSGSNSLAASAMPISAEERAESAARRAAFTPKKAAAKWVPYAMSLVVVGIMAFVISQAVRVDPVAALKTSVRQKTQELANFTLAEDAVGREESLREIESYLQALEQHGETKYVAAQRDMLERRGEKERRILALYDVWWGAPAALTDELAPYLSEDTEPDPGIRRLARSLKEKATLIPVTHRTAWVAPGSAAKNPAEVEEGTPQGSDPAPTNDRAGGAEATAKTPPSTTPSNATPKRRAYEANQKAIEELASIGQWAAALELARLDINESASRADDGFGPQRAERMRQLHLRALVALQNLRDEVRSLRDRRKPQSALELVRERLPDFPADGEFDQLRPLERELEARLLAAEQNLANGGAGTQRIAPALAEAEVGEALNTARELESTLRFEEARTILEPARSTRDLASLALVESALREVEGQAAALAACAAWITSDREAAAKVALKFGTQRGAATTANEAGLVVAMENGEQREVPWSELGASNMQKLLAKARASMEPDAKFYAALMQQRFAEGKSAEEAALAPHLIAAMDEDPQRREIFASYLARMRGEAMPAGGYEWFEGRWMTLRERNTRLEAQEIGALLAKLDSADAAVRQEAADELSLRGAEANDALLVALNTRAEEIAVALRQTKINDELQKVAALRVQLDAARAHAVELIFDQDKYFYPYRPPECPGEKAKLYPAVQQEVDRRVQAVRDLWENPLVVKLPKSVRTLCGSLRELSSLGAQFGVDVVSLSADVAWAFGVEANGNEPISVREFGVDLDESKRLMRDRLLLAWNRAAAEKHGASSQEIRQVEITNEYRRMLGRPVLAWNAKMQRSTRSHSEEMSRLGYFSHFSPTPERRTPGQRMALEGYGRGHGENIATNGGADGAHVAWIHSSGHHRNLLSAGHTEMATGNLGIYWTQNFGGLREYMQDSLWIQLAEGAGL